MDPPNHSVSRTPGRPMWAPQHGDLAVGAEHRPRQPVQQLGQERGEGERAQQAEADDRVEGGEDPAPQLVGHVLLQEGEADHVARPGAEAEGADEQQGRREGRRRWPPPAGWSPAPKAASTNRRSRGRWRCSTPRARTPTATPEAERGVEEAEAGRPAAEHLAGEVGAEGHDHPAAEQPGGQADHDRLHDRVAPDEAPAVLQLVEGLAQVDPAVGPPAPAGACGSSRSGRPTR